jgi:four helix bundle protein
VARELLAAVLACRIADPVLRAHALRSAKSTCLNIAEGAGRVSPREKARAFSIARGEAVEASAAVEIAAICGEAQPSAAREVAQLSDRLFALVTGLIR